MTINGHGFVMLALCLPSLCTGTLRRLTNTNFELKSWTSGVAASDIDQDWQFEVLVAIMRDANIIIRFNREKQLYEDISATKDDYSILKDSQARTVSVSACDIDGDGVEEIYLHNLNDVYSDASSVVTPDRLIRINRGQLIDVFGDPVNRELAPRRAGHSVACIDRTGDGKYAFFVTTVIRDGKGVYRMFAVNDTHIKGTDGQSIDFVAEISREANIRMIRDGRGIAVGPIVGKDNLNDIFITNDNSYYVGSATFRHDGSNVLLRNNGDGTFTDVAHEFGVQDGDENGRGTALGDFTGDDITDLMYVNWLGPGRLKQFRRQRNNTTETVGSFGVSGPSKVLLTADLDNDGNVEVVRGNTDEASFYSTQNVVLSMQQELNNVSSIEFKPFNIGDKEFPLLHITGWGWNKCEIGRP